jgi:ATP-dependent RNA helicase DeaD
MLKQAGINAAWGAAPQADDIRKLDQQRMLQDTLFTEGAADDDLALARALLAERSAEDIAVALARLHRARLPSPEDLLDPGHGRSRDDHSPGKDGRPSRGDDVGARTGTGAGSRTSRIRDNMAEGSVWFTAGIGRKKNADVRWLLPMICRRGGISKPDIGAINILDTTTEFEVSKGVAESFATRIAGPDKEDNIRIEKLDGEPQQRPVPSEKRSYKPSKKPWRERQKSDAKGHQGGQSREERSPKRSGKPHSQHASRFDKDASFKKGQNHAGKPAHAGKPERSNASNAKHAFAKARKTTR